MQTKKSTSMIGKVTESSRFWKGIKLLPVLLATSSLVSCLSPKQSNLKKSNAQELLASAQKAEKEKVILEELKAKSYYDEETQVSYVIETLPTDIDVLAAAAKNHIFFAEPGFVSVFTTDKKTISDVIKNGGVKISNDVYKMPIQGNAVDAQSELRKKYTLSTVGLLYHGYFDGAVSYDDPLLNPPGTGAGQDSWLLDAGWTINGIADGKSDDIDSVETKQSMHIESTPTNPNVVVNIFGGGYDPNHSELLGRSIYNYNFEANSPVVTPSNHEMSVASLVAAKTHNGVGGGALWQGVIRNFDIGNNTTYFVSDFYEALDQLILLESLYPNQHQINNFSLGSGNDPIVASKLDALKHSINVASSGNSGSLGIARPAKWTNRAIAVGATSTSNNKNPWSGESYGPEMMFAKDGEFVKALQVNGSYDQVTGTSFSAPLVTANVATIVAQDTSRTMADVVDVLKDGARDINTPGWDQYTGYGWPEANRALNAQVMKHMPTSFPSNIHSYNLVPKYYNGIQTTAEKCVLPNGTNAPMITNANNQVEFTLNFTTANGFVPGNNTIKYQFTAGGTVHTIYKTFTLSQENLPITLLDFKTTIQNKNDVVSVVRTSSESNTRDFVLEYSTNGRDFVQLGAPQQAAGNSQTVKSYTFVHKSAPVGTYFYRVKQTDNDGKFTYTPTTNVTIKEGPKTISFYPNPASDIVNISGEAKQLVIVDMSGKVLQNNTLNGATTFNVTNLPIGMYLVRVVSKDGIVSTQKLQVKR